jgi:type IV pilus assembly protein PilM
MAGEQKNKFDFGVITRKIKEYLIPYNAVLGIDIGTTSIKVVELGQSDGTISLKNYGILENFGHLERDNAAIQTSSLKIMDEVTAEMLKEVLNQMGPTVKNAMFSLPAFSSFVTVMDLPNLSEKEMREAVPYEAPQYIPFPLTDVVLDWQVLQPLPGADTSRVQVLLVAVLQDVVNKYYHIAQMAGLNLKALELESLSLARALVGNDPTASVVIDMGSRATSISVVDEKDVRMTHDIDTAGNDLTLAISRGLNVSTLSAEQMKKDKGLAVVSDAQYLPALITPLLDVVIHEVQKVKQRYFEKNRREVKRAILTGGGILPPGIKDYIGQELGIETVFGSPFQKISYDPGLEPIVKDIGSTLSAALGIALRDF